MSLPLLRPNNVKVYNVSGYKQDALPEWMLRRKKKKVDILNNRVDLIQDFDFPEASQIIQMTPDCRSIIACGTYKPQVRVFDLDNLTLKFDRHVVSETVALKILSEDWTRFALLQSDRFIELHTKGGFYYHLRIPRPGRCMEYNFCNAEILVGASGDEVYRLSLDRGQFMKPFQVGAACNSMHVNPAHQLYAFGLENSSVEFFDPRNRTRVAELGVGSAVSSVQFMHDGLHLALGTSTGIVNYYDMRSSSPLFSLDLGYGLPVVQLSEHASSGTLMVADKKMLKIFKEDKLMTFIEPPSDLNGFCAQKDTGFIALANEGSQVQSYYIPELGPAPKWCAFLDSMTEELEEQRSVQYDNYKFITMADMRRYGLDHLIGSKVVKAYMHGYLIDIKLFEHAKAIANPFAYEEYKAKKSKEKLDALQKSRIKVEEKPRVNKNKIDSVKDGRFKAMFFDDDFAEK